MTWGWLITVTPTQLSIDKIVGLKWLNAQTFAIKKVQFATLRQHPQIARKVQPRQRHHQGAKYVEPVSARRGIRIGREVAREVGREVGRDRKVKIVMTGFEVKGIQARGIRECGQEAQW